MDRASARPEQHKDIARAAIELWSTGDLIRAERIFAPSYRMRQHHDPDASGDLDLTALLSFVTEFRRAFPDLTDTVDLQLAEGDLVATRFTSTGTHTGTYQGIAPTGRRLRWTGTVIDRIAAGRIVESWGNWDMLGMLQQMDAVTLTT